MVTMKEIAKASGVSQATVSLILNKKSSTVRISDKTEKKVLAAAEKLGYRRNELASSMKTGRNYSIGFISCLPTGYTLEMVAGLTSELEKNGYLLKIFLPKRGGEQYTVKEAAIKCIEQRLAGVVCHSLSSGEFAQVRHELEKYDIPVVVADSDYDISPACVSVMTDEVVAAEKATEYLADLGHRRIGTLCCGSDAYFAVARLQGYKQGLQAAGIPFTDDMVCTVDTAFGLTQTQETIISDYLHNYQPTAVFCSTDPLAMKLLQVAYKLKIDIPGELSVVGFGGLDYSFISSPPLTTLDQPFSQIGQVAAQRIIALSEKGMIPESKRKTCLPVELLVRESTAAPRQESCKLVAGIGE